MQIYLQLDMRDIDEQPSEVLLNIEAWLEDNASATLLNQHAPLSADDFDFSNWRLGIEMDVAHKQQLKEPLNFLYGLAKDFKLEFVVGVYQSGEAEDVCYFGFEEGRPDLFEMANYLGL